MIGFLLGVTSGSRVTQCWVRIRREAEMGRMLMGQRGGSRNRSTLPSFPRRFQPYEGQCSWLGA